MDSFIRTLSVFFMLLVAKCVANEIDYSDCSSLKEIIIKETQEINNTHFTDYVELAQLYVARGESYLLNTEFDKAVEDFQKAHFYLKMMQNFDSIEVLAFRIAFGEAVCYDNLNMQENVQIALQQLQVLVNHIGCEDCVEDRPCQETNRSMLAKSSSMYFFKTCTNLINARDIITFCKQKEKKEKSNQTEDKYDDILGPNQADSGWCEEVIVGTGRAMDAIACLAPNHIVKITLIGVIEALITRGVK